MKIVKEAGMGGGCTVGAEELEQINQLARKELTAAEVYTFELRLCDNEIERFSRETLEGLAELFVGKSGIFDHNWSAAGQAARIYKAQVVEEEGKTTRAGDPGCYLKGWAYMLRTEGNAELIAQIEGGIKKEVSVGCAVEASRCSVCGAPMGQCGHKRGETYDGKLCFASLEGATDAYEWSFVAVPAQPRAGVIKGLEPSLKELCRDEPRAEAERRELEKAADLGRRYLEELRGQVVRLTALREPRLEVELIRSIAEKLSGEELSTLKTFLEGEDDRPKPQLSYGAFLTGEAAADGAFLV